MPPAVLPAACLFPAPSRSAASCPDRGNTSLSGGAGSSAVYPGSFLRLLPRHGTDHDSKPLPSFSGIRLPARPLQSRQEEHRSRRAAAQGLGGGLLALPSAGARLRSTARSDVSSSSLSGDFWFSCCTRCGASIAAVACVVVEEVPWGDGKRTLTKAYMLFLARWARRLSWKETAEAFRTSWDKVFDAVEYVVTLGLEHRTLGPDRRHRRR